MNITGSHGLLGDAWSAEAPDGSLTTDAQRYYMTAQAPAAESTVAKWLPLLLIVAAVALVATSVEGDET